MSILQSIGTWLQTLFGGASPGPAAAGEDRDDKKDKAATPSAGPPSADLTAAIVRVRATARTIVAGFAAIAALVVGTAPLDKIGELEYGSWQFWLAVGSVVGVVVGITVVIGAAASVDAPVAASALQLSRAETGGPLPATLAGDAWEMRDAATWIKDADLVDVRDGSGGFPDSNRPITFLMNQRDQARTARLQSRLEVESELDPVEREKREKQYAGWEARFTRLDDELSYVVHLANYRRITRRFNVRKEAIIVGALIAAFGLVGFKYAVSAQDGAAATPPSSLAGITLTRAVGVDFTGAAMAGAHLQGADLRRAKLTSANLTAANLSGADLTGADLGTANLSAADLTGARGLTADHIKDATWVGATCPDGFVVADAADSCAEDHLTTR
jgi:hypothetical protein